MVLSLGIMGIIQILLVFGFKNYTLWSDLGSAASPHVLYAVNMLGKWGRYWMIIVAIFAAVSTQNSIILFGFGNMLRNGKDESSSGVFSKEKQKRSTLLGYYNFGCAYLHYRGIGHFDR